MGVTVTNCKAAVVILTAVVPVIPPAVALMFTPPAATPVTMPWTGTPVATVGIPGSLLTIATAGLADDQCAELVTSCRLPSGSVAMATRPDGTPWPNAIGGGGGNGSSSGQLDSGLLMLAGQTSMGGIRPGLKTRERSHPLKP